MTPPKAKSIPSPLRGEGEGGGDGSYRSITQFSRQLRSTMTDAEHLLWRHLRMQQLAGFRFRRQHPIGPYIADFICLGAKLIVEIDGGQHATSKTDRARDRWLQAEGCEVLRFWNSQVLDETEVVLEQILTKLGKTTPSLTLPPQGGG